VQRILALDIGKRRTGVAFAMSPEDIVMSLETIEVKTIEALVHAILLLVNAKKITMLAVGNPLLLDGTEGSQVEFVKECTDALRQAGMLEILMVDERYSSYGVEKKYADAKAACSIAEIALRHCSSF
jgi:putative Holliday junction resolvase